MVKIRMNSNSVDENDLELNSRPQRDGTRLLSVQALRAVWALLVAWAHSIDSAEAALGTPSQAHFFYWENFGASGLDIFFIKSGFIVSLVAVRVGDLYQAIKSALPTITPDNAAAWFRTCLNWVQLT